MINWFIEEIYKFYENPSNLAEFEEWRKEKHNDENDMAVKNSSISDDNRNSRIYRNWQN